MKTALISVAVLVVVLLDLVASIRLGRATVHSRAQQLAWLMLVWLVPFIGAVLALGVLSESNLPASPRKSGESGSEVWIPGIGGDDGGSGGHPG